MNQETKNFLNFRESTQIIEVKDSKLIKRIIYDYPSEELTVHFFPSYFTQEIIYVEVPSILFEEMVLNRSNSYGKFYLKQIKPFFKQKNYKLMSDEKKMPNGVNIASDKKRFIRGRINLSMIEKDLLTQGKTGVFLDFTLQMLPNGEVDRYENLGMLTQDVPTEVYKKDKDRKGKILGNMRENVWDKSSGGTETVPGTQLDIASPEAVDDLPF